MSMLDLANRSADIADQLDELQKNVEKLKKQAFMEGVKEGLALFSYIKDNVQYVNGLKLESVYKKLDDGKYDYLLNFPK